MVLHFHCNKWITGGDPTKSYSLSPNKSAEEEEEEKTDTDRGSSSGRSLCLCLICDAGYLESGSIVSNRVMLVKTVLIMLLRTTSVIISLTFNNEGITTSDDLQTQKVFVNVCLKEAVVFASRFVEGEKCDDAGEWNYLANLRRAVAAGHSINSGCDRSNRIFNALVTCNGFADADGRLEDET
ncbi:hypothetical protein D9C73_010697 [Collichthys lucidus]|uniref:Uncharacterized protein n=1 Tax=Collichthys lucidus TaxID=240159 RepID=A0A4U5UPW7_COLLU|nr:hypothetical protein D9C73_010697 [Collichthys lucidus]